MRCAGCILVLLAAAPALGDGLPIKSGSSSTMADVDANKAIKTAPQGADGTPYNTTYEGRLNVGRDTVRFDDVIDGTTVDWRKWTTSVSTWAIAQASNVITLNSASSAAAGSAILQSLDQFTPYHEAFVYSHSRLRFRQGFPQAGVVVEHGFGAVSGSSAPTDGGFMRWNAATFECVSNVGGVERAVNMSATPAVNTYYHAEVFWNSEQVICILADEAGAFESTATVDILNSAIGSTATGRQPLFLRAYATGATSPAPLVDIGFVGIYQQVLDFNIPYARQMEQLGHTVHTSPAAAFGSLQGSCNSATSALNVRTSVGGACGAIASCTLSNTTACLSNLGGTIQIAAQVAGTDAIAVGYTVPSPMQLHVTQLYVQCVNLGAANAATPATTFEWFVAANSTALSLATADSLPTTMEPRRLVVGYTTIPISSAIGVSSNQIAINFDPGITVSPGRLFHVGVKVVAGAATASQLIQCSITPNGYFE